MVPPAGTDDFYIGYEPMMPRGTARMVRCAVWGAAAAALVVVAVVLAAQRALPEARFEFGQTRQFTGVVLLDPYPRLRVMEHGTPNEYWLAARGKRGAEPLTIGLDGRTVRLEASLIARGRRRMLEVRPGSIEVVRTPHAATAASRLVPVGQVTLHGEIVDRKCFLGVMNPSEGAVHRDCAVACLRGGLPPMLHTVGRDGREALVVLVSPSGEPVGREIARLAGRPVAITGTLFRRGDDDVLTVESVRGQILILE